MEKLIRGQGDIHDEEIMCPDKENSSGKKVCDVCGREAIGMQILGCCASTVCEEHAEQQLRGLSPGEKLQWGVCYFVRFPEDPDEK